MAAMDKIDENYPPFFGLLPICLGNLRPQNSSINRVMIDSVNVSAGIVIFHHCNFINIAK